MKRYGYHRTSTREQHLDRGIKEITAYCEQNNLELEKIFTDQQTGKNFNRPRYQVLKEDVLRAGDELIITEVDRLGRNKQETLKELQYYMDNDIRVKILELPTTLTEDVGHNQWDGRCVCKPVSQFYAKGFTGWRGMRDRISYGSIL